MLRSGESRDFTKNGLGIFPLQGTNRYLVVLLYEESPAAKSREKSRTGDCTKQGHLHSSTLRAELES